MLQCLHSLFALNVHNISTFSVISPSGPVPLAVRSKAWVLIYRALGLQFRIPLEASLFVFVFLFCAVLCRQRPCVELITLPGSRTKCETVYSFQKSF
jgi:hypothetical protein